MDSTGLADCHAALFGGRKGGSNPTCRCLAQKSRASKSTQALWEADFAIVLPLLTHL